MASSRRHKKSLKKGGSCGCQGSQTPFFSGGKKRRQSRRRKTRGGSALGGASLTNFDAGNKYTYSLFDVSQDPHNPAAVTDARLTPQLSTTPLYGGMKSRKRRRSSKRRYRGGDYVSSNSISNLREHPS